MSMGRDDVVEAIAGVMSENDHDRPEDLPDAEAFCESVARWVSVIRDHAEGEDAVARGPEQSMLAFLQDDDVASLVEDGLHEDVDADHVDRYLAAFASLKTLADDLTASWPKSFPRPSERQPAARVPAFGMSA